MDEKRIAKLRFEAGRALRMAHHLSAGEMSDTHQAVRDLAKAVTSLAQAVDELLARQEETLLTGV